MIGGVQDSSEPQICWRSEAPAAFALSVILFGVYLWTMPPTVTLEDSGGFIAVAYYAGIAPPGCTPCSLPSSRGFRSVPWRSACTD